MHPENYKNGTDPAYEAWKTELIRVTAEQTNQDPLTIKINDQGAREWYDSGATPYQTFRETWQNENDGGL